MNNVQRNNLVGSSTLKQVFFTDYYLVWLNIKQINNEILMDIKIKEIETNRIK